jgi:hypothetical protein
MATTLRHLREQCKPRASTNNCTNDPEAACARSGKGRGVCPPARAGSHGALVSGAGRHHDAAAGRLLAALDHVLLLRLLHLFPPGSYRRARPRTFVCSDSPRARPPAPALTRARDVAVHRACARTLTRAGARALWRAPEVGAPQQSAGLPADGRLRGGLCVRSRLAAKRKHGSHTAAWGMCAGPRPGGD